VSTPCQVSVRAASLSTITKGGKRVDINVPADSFGHSLLTGEATLAS
jgi:hypothetical protein